MAVLAAEMADPALRPHQRRVQRPSPNRRRALGKSCALSASGMVYRAQREMGNGPHRPAPRFATAEPIFAAGSLGCSRRHVTTVLRQARGGDAGSGANL